MHQGDSGVTAEVERASLSKTEEQMHKVFISL